MADVVKMWVLSHGSQELPSYWLNVMVSAVSASGVGVGVCAYA